MAAATTSQALDLPGAEIHYDVRPAETAGDAPALMLIGSPMDASGFVTLASHFTDRTVITYDPRGVSRSVKADPESESTPDEHADDIAAVIAAAGVGPVDLFASSGGAVNALAAVARHPEAFRTVVAHEPPSTPVLPDREAAAQACHDIQDTYRREGVGRAMAIFIPLVMHKGEVPAGFADHAPDPATFGLPAEDDGRRTDPLVGQNIVTCCTYVHDYDALRASPARVVIAVGAESEGELAHRAGRGIAERIGQAPEVFPSGHAGFLGGEFGQHGEPEAFAEKLREVLAG